jgi:hypothetical protein
MSPSPPLSPSPSRERGRVLKRGASAPLRHPVKTRGSRYNPSLIRGNFRGETSEGGWVGRKTQVKGGEGSSLYNLLLLPQLVALYLAGAGLGQVLNKLYPPGEFIRRYALLDEGLNILGQFLRWPVTLFQYYECLRLN